MKVLNLPLLLLLASCAAPLAGQDQGSTLHPVLVGRVALGPANEISGIAKSRNHPDLYWVHNDSGDKARIFAINGTGAAMIPTELQPFYYGEEAERGKRQWPGFMVEGARNRDWEAMTVDEDYLYIADTGNNLNNRRDLGIYQIRDIDPASATHATVVKRLPVRFPEQQSFPGSVWRFDSESLFSSDGKLYLIAKHRHPGQFMGGGAGGVTLYRLDTYYSDRDNLLVYVDSHRELSSSTGAEVSPDGQTLAVITYSWLSLFDKPASGDAWLSSSSRSYGFNFSADIDDAAGRVENALPLLSGDALLSPSCRHCGFSTSIEAVAWKDDNTLLVAGENRRIYQISLPER